MDIKNFFLEIKEKYFEKSFKPLVILVHITFIYGDATGNEMLEEYKLLKRLGFDISIYAKLLERYPKIFYPS